MFTESWDISWDISWEYHGDFLCVFFRDRTTINNQHATRFFFIIFF
jgi:hypothetical protein